MIGNPDLRPAVVYIQFYQCFTWDSYGRKAIWISIKAFIALEARDLVNSPNKESGIAAENHRRTLSLTKRVTGKIKAYGTGIVLCQMEHIFISPKINKMSFCLMSSKDLQGYTAYFQNSTPWNYDNYHLVYITSTSAMYPPSSFRGSFSTKLKGDLNSWGLLW